MTGGSGGVCIKARIYSWISLYELSELICRIPSEDRRPRGNYASAITYAPPPIHQRLVTFLSTKHLPPFYYKGRKGERRQTHILHSNKKICKKCSITHPQLTESTKHIPSSNTPSSYTSR